VNQCVRLATARPPGGAERLHYRNRVDLLVHKKQRQEVLKDLGADPYVN
jgi:hypothetical protein